MIDLASCIAQLACLLYVIFCTFEMLCHSKSPAEYSSASKSGSKNGAFTAFCFHFIKDSADALIRHENALGHDSLCPDSFELWLTVCRFLRRTLAAPPRLVCQTESTCTPFLKPSEQTCSTHADVCMTCVLSCKQTPFVNLAPDCKMPQAEFPTTNCVSRVKPHRRLQPQPFHSFPQPFRFQISPGPAEPCRDTRVSSSWRRPTGGAWTRTLPRSSS